MAEANRDFILTRTLDAPRALVWKAWTDREELMRWFGPKGFTMPIAKMDLRPGGTFHYCLRTPAGVEMWGNWTFREVVAPERLVVINSFSDAAGGITRHPMSPTWPRETLSTTTFAEQAGKTLLTVNWSAYNATDEEQKTFDGAHAGMEQGWGGTMQQLTAYLAEIQK